MEWALLEAVGVHATESIPEVYGGWDQQCNLDDGGGSACNEHEMT